ncbi:MAG: TIGR02996 domain-containing protein [Myxococcota bacterium]
MSIAPELLSAVLADPLADAPRQIAADWLDEHGDVARATLIRLQLRVAQGPADARETVRAARHAHTLERLHHARWRAELPEFEGIHWGTLDRGFFGTVEVDHVGALFNHADAIQALQPVHTVRFKLEESKPGPWVAKALPWVRAIQLVGSDRSEWFQLSSSERSAIQRLLGDVPSIEAWANSAEDDVYDDLLRALKLPRLRTFRIRGHHTLATLHARRAVKQGYALETLDLGTDFVDYDSGYFEDPTLGVDGARLIAGADALGDLRELNLDLQRLGNEGAELLLNRFTKLERISLNRLELNAVTLPEGAPVEQLRLADNDIAGDQLGFLHHPRLAALRELDLRQNPLALADVHHIIEAPCWSSLRTLNLSETALAGLGDLLASASPPQALHTLRLEDCELSPNDVARLAELPWIRSLEELVVHRNLVEDALAAFGDARIAVLNLGESGLLSDHALNAHSTLRNVEHLDLNNNHIGPALPMLLADAPNLTALDLTRVPDLTWSSTIGEGAPQLVRLSLEGTNLGNRGLALLVEGPLGEQLVDLDLTRCGLTSEAIETLLAWPRLPHLDRLLLRNNAFDEADLLRLAGGFPKPLRMFRVTGQPWRYSSETNEELTRRFGARWAEYA